VIPRFSRATLSVCGTVLAIACSSGHDGTKVTEHPDASAGGGGTTSTGGASGGSSTGGIANASGGTTSGSGGATTGTGGSGNAGRDAGQDGAVVGASDASASDGAADASCLAFSVTATPSPSAMLVVLSGAASMTANSKWATAQTSLVQAFDRAAFDDASLGLLTYPSALVEGPACLCSALGLGAPPCGFKIACGAPSVPQVALSGAGTDRSTASQGVRHDVYQFLVSHQPLSSSDDGAPMYDSLNAAYTALGALDVARRAAVLVTDGGGSCTSLGNPPRPGYTDGICPDWEEPDTINARIVAARTDASKPIDTFVIGLPGTASHGEQLGSFATAPYPMLLALSTYAVSGSPGTVDPSCSKSDTFSKSGADPAKPCHIDLSQPSSFTADALAGALQTARRKAFGCVYDLPAAPVGQTIDPGLVNVVVTADQVAKRVPRRASASDTCADSPCWDYDASGRIELVGVACSDADAAGSFSVSVDVGCATVTK